MNAPRGETGTSPAERESVRHVVTAVEAVPEVERLADAVLSATGAVPYESGDHVRHSAQTAIASAIGRAAAGVRSVAVLEGSEPGDVQAVLAGVARSHVPLVVHHRCVIGPSGGASGYEAYFALRDSRAFQLFAAGPQEIVDLQIIAHRIAEAALLPGICAEDLFESHDDLCTVYGLTKEQVRDFLGRPQDMIQTPTPAQRILFGETRRRLPRFLDLDHPAGLGARLDDDAGPKALAGQGVYFYDHVAEIAAEAFTEFARITGRAYGPISSYRLGDARYVLVAQGAISLQLKAAVDRLRSRGHKAGVLTIRMFRPFAGAELCRLLRSKRAVTIVENAQQGFAENAPLTAEVRSAFDRALESNLEDGGEGMPAAFPRFDRGDRPSLYTAICSAAVNHEEDIDALIGNMLPGAPGLRIFQVGVRFDTPTSRVPALERLSQLLESAYDGIGRLGLATGGRGGRTDRSAVGLSLYGSADQGLGAVTRAAGQSIFDLTGWSVLSRPTRRGAVHRFEPSGWRISHSDSEDDPSISAAVLLAAAENLNALVDDRVVASVAAGGSLVVGAPDSPGSSWHALPARVLSAIRDGDLKVFEVPTERIARSLSEDRWVRRQLGAQALAGAAVVSYPPLMSLDTEDLVEAYGRALRAHWQMDDGLLDQCLQAFDQGARSSAPVEVPLPADAAVGDSEPPAPWTVRDVPVHEETVFDSGRFWNSVGYLYETGQSERTLSDPYVATGVVPARTAAFRSWQTYRAEIPQFLPENCTACGACFTACPDAAIPATIVDVGSLFESALRKAEAQSGPFLQLRRLQKHLVKTAHRLFAGDARHEYCTAGDLFAAAFTDLVARMEQGDDEAEALRAELERAVAPVRTFPIARTDTFFLDPESGEKGSGLLFSLNINPDSCKACGICSAVCLDSAIEIVDQTSDLVSQYRHDWRVASELDPPSRETVDRFVSDDRPDTLAYRLLDRRTYHTAVGGDSSFPGSGTQATLHIIAGMADSVVRPRVEQFVTLLDECAGALERKIRDHLQQSVEINDFEEFGRRLEALSENDVKPEVLAGIATGDATIDRGLLQRMNNVLLEVKEATDAYAAGRGGLARSSLVGVLDDSRSPTDRGYYPYNPFAFPWINTRADAVAVGEGVFDAVSDVILSGIRVLRKARLILDDAYDPAEHDSALAGLGWVDLSDDEWRICPPICIVTSDGSQALPHLLRARAPIKVFLLSSSDTMPGSVSDVRLWPLARPDLFALRSTLGVRGHFLAGLTEGLERRGPALFHLYVAEPSEHGFVPAASMDRMRLAVESRAFPLMKYSPDVPGEWAHRWSLEGNPAVDADWLSTRRPGTESEEIPLMVAHWAAEEARFGSYLRHVPQNRWTDAMCPLAEYLGLEKDERLEKQPYIDVDFRDGKSVRLRVMPDLVRSTERSLHEWRLLQELAGVRSSVVDKVSGEAETRLEAELQRMKDALTAEFEARSRKSSEEYGADFHRRLTDELLSISGFGEDSPAAAQRLSEYLASLAGKTTAQEPDDVDGAQTQGKE